jgi:hypothetical protein
LAPNTAATVSEDVEVELSDWSMELRVATVKGQCALAVEIPFNAEHGAEPSLRMG